ncbi:MAG: GNAT family N-acetyltransferase [Anaerolineae bacterium]
MLTHRVLTTVEELAQVERLEMEIWEVGPEEAVPVSMLQAVIDNGGLLLGAYHDERLIGFAFCFPAYKAGRLYLWSHMTGVHREYQRQAVGYTLKRMQREWALANGYDAIAWTFDPMRRGNANFNLNMLGAVARDYKPNVYGVIQEGINAGLPSDRLVAWWHLNGTDQIGLGSDEVRIEIPYNLTQLKRGGLSEALAWQGRVREAMQTAFAEGYIITTFVTDGQAERCWYVARR